MNGNYIQAEREGSSSTVHRTELPDIYRNTIIKIIKFPKFKLKEYLETIGPSVLS